MDCLNLASAASHGAALASLVTHAAPSPILWYTTRAMAVASYVTLSLSVALGVLQSIGRAARERMFWFVDEIHQFLATLTGALILGHLATLYFDPFLPFSLLNLVAPVNEPCSPFGVTLGVFALYCMVALLVSSCLRRLTGYAFWRGDHYFSFVAFALVTAHGWVAGSDTNEPWMRGLYVGAAGAITFLLLLRLFTNPRDAASAA
jgi:methionine sulfoxide reductase heme-binding subunit